MRLHTALVILGILVLSSITATAAQPCVNSDIGLCASGTQMLNGGFESGDFQGWSTYGFPVLSSTVYHGGHSYAVRMLYGVVGWQYLSQSFASTSPLKLCLWIKGQVENGNDHLYVYVINASGEQRVGGDYSGYSWGDWTELCYDVTSCNPITGVNISGYNDDGLGSDIYIDDISLIYLLLGSPSDVILDVGNDTNMPWEWGQFYSFTGSDVTSDFSAKLNQIISSNCSCSGCSIDGQYCVIPFRFHSAYPGDMNISNIKLEYQSVRVLSSVPYGQPFKFSEGCRWVIQDPSGFHTLVIPSSYGGSNFCHYNTVMNPPSGIKDASIDAMLRLLNQTLDQNKDRIIDIDFNETTMSFQAHGMIGVQSMWGPAIIKVIVWI